MALTGAIRRAPRGSWEPRGSGLYPPEEVSGRDGPPAVTVREAVAETGGLPVREIVPADRVRRRRVQQGEAGHLQDHPAGAGRAVHHPLAARHPALGERLDPGREAPHMGQQGPTRIPPLPRQVIA